MKRLALSFIALVCFSLIVPVGASAKETWISVRSKNFLLIGNGSERDVRQVATRLEQFRDVFSRLFTKAKLSSPIPTTVIVFKSDSSYKPFKPLYNGKPIELAGYFQPGQDVNYITLTTEQRAGNPFGIIFHEFVHLLVKNNLRSTPAWFNEGLAEYYSTFEVSDDEKKVTLGKPIAHHVLLLRERFLPLQTLFNVDHNSPLYNEGEKRSIFYAESWALIHYLVLGNKGQRLPQLARFNELLASGTSVESSFQQAFQTDFKSIEKELQDYVRRNLYSIQVVSFEKRLEFANEMQSAPLTDAEAQAYLGDLLLHTNRPDDAEAHLQQAIALDQSLAIAHASLGMLRVRQNQFAEARQHLQHAVAANSQNYLTHYYYAYALSRQRVGEGQVVTGYPAETAQIMRAELKKAIELKPDYPESYRLLAFVNLVTGEQLDETAPLLMRAMTFAPGQHELALLLAQIYMRKNQFAAARRVLEPIAGSTGAEPQILAQAQSLIRTINSLEEQVARYKSMREASTTPEMSPSKDNQPAETLHPVEPIKPTLKRRADGERVRGLLTHIECSNTGIIFFVKAGDRTLRLYSAALDKIEFTTYVPEISGNISCGPRRSENLVLVTYRPVKSARTKSDGEVIAVDFIPEGLEVDK